jgi:hypothetical protein
LTNLDAEKEIAFLRIKLQESQKELTETLVYLSEERKRRLHLEYLAQGALRDVDFRRLMRENSEMSIQCAEMRQRIRDLEANQQTKGVVNA